MVKLYEEREEKKKRRKRKRKREEDGVGGDGGKAGHNSGQSLELGSLGLVDGTWGVWCVAGCVTGCVLAGNGVGTVETSRLRRQRPTTGARKPGQAGACIIHTCTVRRSRVLMHERYYYSRYSTRRYFNCLAMPDAAGFMSILAVVVQVAIRYPSQPPLACTAKAKFASDASLRHVI